MAKVFLYFLGVSSLQKAKTGGKNMRRKDREIKEFDEIIDVLSRCKVLHLALISDGKPYAVPVNFGYAVCERDGQKKLAPMPYRSTSGTL